MVPVLTTFAETAESAAASAITAKAIMLAVALGAAAIGLGWLGSNYMKALGRNPEAGKAAGQIVIIAAMIEVTALLAFLLGAFLLS
ncbi:F0F1 ATP synthase subunit C [Candidatus Saccharibacteria bacterium]|nr:F0F1 ATP synthase subunit C [Candidatus Saccharibacteria bacterium]